MTGSNFEQNCNDCSEGL